MCPHLHYTFTWKNVSTINTHYPAMYDANLVSNTVKIPSLFYPSIRNHTKRPDRTVLIITINTFPS